MSEIVPIGKYKGQPLEIMLADVDYCEWMSQQPWFREKYTNIYNIVVTGRSPDSDQETPEHNALQAKFLDEDFCAKFLDDHFLSKVRVRDLNKIERQITEFKNDQIFFRRYVDSGFEKEYEQMDTEEKEFYARNVNSFEPSYTAYGKKRLKPKEVIEKSMRYYDGLCQDLEQFVAHGEHCVKNLRIEFEPEGGGDVLLNLDFHRNDKNNEKVGHYQLLIECKPQIGDDYPSVLRQMKTVMAWNNQIIYPDRRKTPDYSFKRRKIDKFVLYVREFNSSVINQEDLVKFFASSGIKVIQAQ